MAMAVVEATVTDAHVVLGHLPARLLGGRMALDAAAARKAVDGGHRHAARPDGRGRRARHPGDHRQQHGGRRARRLGRAWPRSAQTSPWCRSAAQARCMAARSPSLLGISRVLIPCSARRAVRRRAAGRRPEGRIQPHPAEGRSGRRRRRGADLRRAAGAGGRVVRRRGRRRRGPPDRRTSRCCAIAARAARSPCRGRGAASEPRRASSRPTARSTASR